MKVMRLLCKSILEQSGDFEFTIRYRQCTYIPGTFGHETIEGICFEIFLMEYCIVNIWNPY